MAFSDLCARDYYPGFSTMLLDHWRRFDAECAARELDALLAAHPGTNAVRVHHSYDAWQRDRKAYLASWEALLALCAARGLRVIACLFNRWHHPVLDCGGVYLENLVPGISWAYKEGFYADFLSQVCAGGDHDGIVALWETCDKPFGVHTEPSSDEERDDRMYEERWLRELYCYVSQCGTTAPVAISVRPWYGRRELDALAQCCDVLLRSPCYMDPEATEAVLSAAFPGCELEFLTVHTI